jgi:altronate dehydratase large subunit
MEEKSLGAILKGGNTTINEFINYAEIPKKKGLIFMDSLGGGTENITGISAAGAQVIIFTTGTGNPIGSPVSPTIKICGNYNTIINQGDDIDLDVSDIFRKEKTINDLSVSLKRELLDVCNGKMTCSEILENTEIAISIVEGCGGRKSVVKSL